MPNLKGSNLWRLCDRRHLMKLIKFPLTQKLTKSSNFLMESGGFLSLSSYELLYVWLCCRTSSQLRKKISVLTSNMITVLNVINLQQIIPGFLWLKLDFIILIRRRGAAEDIVQTLVIFLVHLSSGCAGRVEMPRAALPSALRLPQHSV